MNKPKITTLIIIICIIILGLYAAGEINYFSSKIAIEKNIESPVVNIPTIGVEEKINNVSLSQGVLHDTNSFTPTHGDVMLSGHRTLQGSPFLRLNELNNGDTISLEWPGIGEVNYTIINKTIVEPTTHINIDLNGNHIYLITCDPIGSTAHRLIIEGEESGVGPLNDKIIQNNPHESYGLIIATGFLILGLIFSYFYSKDDKIYVLSVVLIISIILFYFYLFPIDSNIIYEKILWLNGGM
ncbi:class E sortase [uncultured Methanobrevibacter sp.]|uniref:class E sortase n=1 Tax=uncultured Methanobrevibacter sp. TaxID=253161 RepID=UPI002637BC17|nr:class E sortase [uncultured Methanobrevibacter sp.]